MVFTSIQFPIFLAIVILAVYLAPKNSHKKIVLLIASYIFYGAWDYRFLALIITSTIIDYFVGIGMMNSENEGDEGRRRTLLIISLIANLGFLGFFKYTNFFIDSARIALSGIGFNPSNLNIILPVGISFYTFQTMSYSIDVYRRQLKPTKNFLDFSLFVAFFPQLVAGPIVRAIDFMPQLDLPVVIKRQNIWFGLQIFLVGAFKKLLVADALAPFIDKVYAAPSAYSSATIWMAVVAYSLQIFCDFSGYSDMAIGTARMLGFTLPQNFNMPYISRNITEFWRRWHISLSGWLRDYLYIPLGGNRKGVRRTYINLMLTMILGGLWHGASWNFVIWGTIHGVFLAINRALKKYRMLPNNWVGTVISVAVTFVFVSFVWVFFRLTDMSQIGIVFSKLLWLNPSGIDWYYPAFFTSVGLAIVAHAWGIIKGNDEFVFFRTPLSWRAAFVVSFVIIFIFVFAPTDTNPFIYFQF